MTVAIAEPALIADRNVFEISASRVRAGHVLLNGLVVDVDDLTFHFMHCTVEVADTPDQPVTVIGRVSAAVLAAARASRHQPATR